MKLSVGGTFGGIREPTVFIQLVLKMLQTSTDSMGGKALVRMMKIQMAAAVCVSIGMAVVVVLTFPWLDSYGEDAPNGAPEQQAS